MKIALLFTLLLTSPSALASPGDFVALTHLTDAGTAEVAFARTKFCPAEAQVEKAFGFKRYKLDFKTTGPTGNEITSSGMIVVPDTSGQLPMFVYQHGTLFARAELPSSNPRQTESDAIGYCVASLGYASVMADYLGYGDGTGVHPYLHADSEALIAHDMMRASRTAFAQLNVELSAKLFVAGYSQGGHAAMALVRFLERDLSAEFTVTAAAPMAGPYALAETFNAVLKQPVPHSAAEAAYLLVGLNPIYSFYRNIGDFIRPEFAALVEPLFDGTHLWTDVLKNLNMPVQDLFQASALEDAKGPHSKFAQALAANEVYRWTPKAAIRLYHGHGDHEVPYANSEAAYGYMLHQGAHVELINLGDTVDHHAGFPLAIGQAALWFETLR